MLVQAPKESDSGITKLGRSNTFGKNRLNDKFYEGDYKKKMFKCQKIIQTIKKVIKNFQTFFPVKILLMNVLMNVLMKQPKPCSRM